LASPLESLKISHLGSFRHFAGLDALRANLLPAIGATGKFHANRLKIRVEPSSGFVVSVGNIVSELRALAANIAPHCHKNCLRLIE
jgi:hypothetical protein